MPFRFHHVTTHYPEYARRFYADRPGLAERPYTEQYAALAADCFGWADFWAQAMTRAGHAATETLANVEPLQKRWAMENDVAAGPDWLEAVALAQINAFQPDVVFVSDFATLQGPFLRRLRRACPSVRLLIGWCGAPAKNQEVFGEYDLVLSNIPGVVERFRAGGVPSQHLRHAFGPEVLGRLGAEARPTAAFAFLGSVVLGDGGHHGRAQLLQTLSTATPLEIWANVSRSRRARLVERLGAVLPQLVYERLPGAPLLAATKAWRSRPPLFGLAMYGQMRASKVCLNSHIDLSHQSASNMRLFEATGVGACLLTDWKSDLATVFEPDREVVTYRSAAECVDKALYLLEHEDECRDIAAAGQRRTLRDHTFDQRAFQLDAIIREGLHRCRRRAA